MNQRNKNIWNIKWSRKPQLTHHRLSPPQQMYTSNKDFSWNRQAIGRSRCLFSAHFSRQSNSARLRSFLTNQTINWMSSKLKKFKSIFRRLAFWKVIWSLLLVIIKRDCLFLVLSQWSIEGFDLFLCYKVVHSFNDIAFDEFFVYAPIQNRHETIVSALFRVELSMFRTNYQVKLLKPEHWHRLQRN